MKNRVSFRELGTSAFIVIFEALVGVVGDADVEIVEVVLDHVDPVHANILTPSTARRVSPSTMLGVNSPFDPRLR